MGPVINYRSLVFDAMLVFLPLKHQRVLLRELKNTESKQIICHQSKACPKIVKANHDSQTWLYIRIISIDFNEYSCVGPNLFKF